MHILCVSRIGYHIKIRPNWRQHIRIFTCIDSVIKPITFNLQPKTDSDIKNK